MNMEKTGLTPGSFSLLQPTGAVSSFQQQNDFLELSPGALHDWGFDEILSAFAPGTAHQKEIRAHSLNLGLSSQSNNWSMGQFTAVL